MAGLIPLLNSCIKNSCSALSLTDTTGLYHETDNPTGYSENDAGPNIDPNDPNFLATITIDGGDPIDVTSQVPNPVIGNFTFNDIAIPLADGWHEVVYRVSSDTGSATNTINFFTSCNIDCCIQKKMAEMRFFDPCKDGDKIMMYMFMWSQYLRLRLEAMGCYADKATETLKRLQELCGVEVDCGCH